MAEHTCPGGIFADVRLLLSTDIYLGRVKATPLVGPAEGSARVLCRLAAVNTTGRFLDVSLAAVLESQLRGPGGCCARYGPRGASAIYVKGTRVFFRGPNYVSDPAARAASPASVGARLLIDQVVEVYS